MENLTNRDLINRIRKIIGRDQKLTISFWKDEVWFDIYEVSITILVKPKEKLIFLNADTTIDSKMLKELYKIIELIKEKLDIIQA